jgi:hypothetical protein
MNRSIFKWRGCSTDSEVVTTVWKRRVAFAMILAGAILIPSDSQATIVALFDFNDMSTNNDGTTVVTVDNAMGVPTLELVEESGPLADLNGQGGVSFDDEAGASHSSGQSAGWTSGVLNTSTDPNDTWLLSVDTRGFTDLMLRFNYRLTSAEFQGDDLQGPTQLTVDWKQGGGSFNTIQTFDLTRDNAYHEFMLDLSGIAAIQNAAGVQVRGTWSNDATETIVGGAFPSARIDNMQLTGVPEPASFVLMAWGPIAVLIVRPRRKNSVD